MWSGAYLEVLVHQLNPKCNSLVCKCNYQRFFKSKQFLVEHDLYSGQKSKNKQQQTFILKQQSQPVDIIYLDALCSSEVTGVSD